MATKLDFDKDAFLLRADENAEMLVDQAFGVIGRALNGGPIPDPCPISRRNLRLLILSAFKAGATYGLEEVITIADRHENGEKAQ